MSLSSHAAPAVLAHRGASAATAENTIAAFELAGLLGADGVELDVRATRDGHLVVVHDTRVPGGGDVHATNRSDLPEHIPDLDAALAACPGLFVDVEIKRVPADAAVGPADVVARVLDVVGRARGLTGHVITSFDIEIVDAVRAASPDTATGHIVDRGDPVLAIRECRARGHRTIAPADILVDEVFVALAEQSGLRVMPWTIDDPARIASLCALGVDAIITNAPDVAVAAVRRASR